MMIRVRLGGARLARAVAACCVVSAVCGLALTGCAPSGPSEAGQDGAGMGMGAADDAKVMVDGVIAASRNALVDLGPAMESSSGVTVARVVAPVDGWVVVRSVLGDGAVLGRTWVPAGASRAVPVTLRSPDGVGIRVAVHVDRGVPKVFEFDPARSEPSADARVWADGKPVEVTTALRGFGTVVPANTALLLVRDQAITAGSLHLDYVIVPERSWISVNLVEGGLPGRRVGLAQRPAGEWHEVPVPLDAGVPAGEVAVTVHADRGEAGRFEYDPDRPLGSGDGPYVDAGVVVSLRINVRR